MSNINETNNNVDIFANGGLHAIVKRDTHTRGALFVVKDVQVLNEVDHIIQLRNEDFGNSSTTIFDIPTGRPVVAGGGACIMQLSSGSSGSGNGDRFSVATFVERQTPIEELHMNFYIPESLFIIEGLPARKGKFRVVVVMCRPQHAAMTDEKYNISASGTITIDWFGDWSFTWDDGTPTTPTDTATSSP